MTMPTVILDEIRSHVTATPDDGTGHSWESTGRTAAAPAALVAKVLPGHTGPVCLGTLEQIASLGPDQWASDEGVWGESGVLTATNREALGDAAAAAIDRPAT